MESIKLATNIVLGGNLPPTYSYASDMESRAMTNWILLFAVALAVTTGYQKQPAIGETAMNKDEQAIQKWFDDWMTATKEGDLELAKSLIADDAIFLVPGAGQMDKKSFAEAATASDPNTDFKLDCAIQEIRVFGDHAWLLATISLEITDKNTNKRSLMKGDGISILQQHGDNWVVIRDANTMISVATDQ